MSVVGGAAWLSVGWTMLHFLWIGGLIGIAAEVLLRVLRGATPEVRYGAALVSLAVLAAAPAVIGYRESLAVGTERTVPEPRDRAGLALSLPVAGPIEEAPAPIARTELAGPAAVAIGGPVRVGVSPPSWASRLDALARRLPWVWLLGSPLTFAWMALGLAGAERLRRRGHDAHDGELPQLCRRLAGELGIAREVAVAICERLTAPVLVGIVRPLILLPAAAMGGWGPEQVEMVLLHELAHVRRWDNLINLLQRLIESALFFHPAVWIISGWVRREREHCCDAIVVGHTGRPRAYAEVLLSLADRGPGGAPRAAVAMAGNDLVARVRRILNLEPEDHAMKLPRGLLALTAAILIVPAGFTIGHAHFAGRPDESQDEGKEQGKPAADGPATIQGKAVDEWLAALKDRDPARRKRAVEVLGEHSVDPGLPADERSKLQTAVTSLLSDKDAGVRKAAAFFADLPRASGSPELVERLLEEYRRTVDPTRRAIRLVDARDRPVAGAVVSHYFSRDADREPAFSPPEPIEAATSNARGLVALELEIPGHLDGVGLYAIRQEQGHPLVGLHKIAREDLDKPITIVMHPACRVRFRIDSKALPALETKYHAELTGPGWWRAAYVLLGGDHRSPRPLFASSTTGELEFLLPPGRVMIHAYGMDVKGADRPIEIQPDDRELSLGSFDLLPSADAEQGRFRDHHRVRRNGAAGGEEIVFRRIRYRPIRGMARDAGDVAFSPDGKLLATAHSYNADPGEVMLWDMTTGARAATLPVGARGVASVAFSPDGRLLAGRVHPIADPRSPWEIILWDVASRRQVRALGGHGGRISALAFAPDGGVLASSGADRAVRFWDVASGREVRRIDGIGSARALAFTPDGRTLILTGGGRPITLWDIAGNRPRPAPEPDDEPFTVYAIALAPDGRTLAAAGAAHDAKGVVRQGQVRLYDLAREPIARRAVLTFDGGAPVVGGPNDRTMMCSDVAFSPDGRQIVAIGMHKVRTWDAATGAERDAFERDSSSSSDRLAVSPDGRWMAITSPFGAGVSILDINPPGP